MVMTAFHPVAAQTPVANTDAVLALPAPTNGSSWSIPKIHFSYSAAPTAGELDVAWTEGATNYLEKYYISGGGPGVLDFGSPRHFPANTAVTITLKAGGGTVLGSVYAPNAITDF